MDINQQQNRLLKRRAELLGGLGDIARVLEHPGSRSLDDRAYEGQGDDVLEAIDRVDRKALRRIDGALARIEDGTYGMCLACGGEISLDRLQAVPESSLCCNCI